MQKTFPISTALKEALKSYNSSKFKADIIAGIIVSMVALPLSMALAIAVGLPPQHGLYTAIVAGIIVPLLGGSTFQVSGPTAAFVVILAPIVSEHGLRGLIITGAIAGIMLVALGLSKLGRYINFVPYPVTTGFTAGIAVVIGTLALNDFLGLGIKSLSGEYLHKVSLIAENISHLNWPEALVGVISLLVMFTSGRFIKKIPSPILGILAGTLITYFLKQHGYEIATIGSRFAYATPDGGVANGIPPYPPEFHFFGAGNSELFALPTLTEIRTLMMPALVVAALAALESLLSAAVADNMAATKHNPNSELVGIGVGNILCALFSGIPATGAIARTATNIHSGAKSPFAAVIHAVLILVYMMAIAKYLSYVPMASLSALLIMVAYRMSHWKQCVNIIKIAPRSDSAVLITCFLFTVIIDMVAGVTVGIVLACFLLVRQISNLTSASISESKNANHEKVKLLNLPDDVMVYHINGLIFFGAVERAFDRVSAIQNSIKTIIIDMENVPFIDMSGIVAMKAMILDLISKKKEVILVGNDEVTDKILRKLKVHTKADIKVLSKLEEFKRSR